MSEADMKLDLKPKVRRIQEFKGVVFWDITPLLKDSDALHESVKRLADHFRREHVDLVVSSEARGFIIGAAVAYELGVGFIPIRKKGKLPYKCAEQRTRKSTNATQSRFMKMQLRRARKFCLLMICWRPVEP